MDHFESVLPLLNEVHPPLHRNRAILPSFDNLFLGILNPVIGNPIHPGAETPETDGLWSYRYCVAEIWSTLLMFSKPDTDLLVEPLKWALVGKFSYGIPPVFSISKMMEQMNLAGECQIRKLSSRQFLLVFSTQIDYFRIWQKPIWHVHGVPMRILKWSPNFSVRTKSSIVPIWIRLTELPVHLYDKSVLWMLGNLIGRHLKVDKATTSLYRANFARILVEINLLDERPDSLLLCINSEIFC